jgi:hypothetical protein
VAERAMPQHFSVRSRKLWDIRPLDAAIDAPAEQTAHSSKWRDVAV